MDNRDMPTTGDLAALCDVIRDVLDRSATTSARETLADAIARDILESFDVRLRDVGEDETGDDETLVKEWIAPVVGP